MVEPLKQHINLGTLDKATRSIIPAASSSIASVSDKAPRVVRELSVKISPGKNEIVEVAAATVTAPLISADTPKT